MFTCSGRRCARALRTGTQMYTCSGRLRALNSRKPRSLRGPWRSVAKKNTARNPHVSARKHHCPWSRTCTRAKFLSMPCDCNWRSSNMCCRVHHVCGPVTIPCLGARSLASCPMRHDSIVRSRFSYQIVADMCACMQVRAVFVVMRVDAHDALHSIKR